MDVQGFRGIDNLRLVFESPITALCGLNGTGKSTLAQLASCAYKRPTTGTLRRYYVKDFFPVSAADPNPFTANAKVIYAYSMQDAGDPQQVTVARACKEWSGYKRQPGRACYYIGFTQFIPKVERRDFSIYGGHLIQLGATRDLTADVARKIAAVLGLSYQNLGFTEVIHRARTAELAMATRAGRRYSENNMGFGEGRVVYMINTMETAPAQSLFILEEPETSLHGEAQERLARYFVDVAARRGHQIVLTTHSAAILGQLGPDSVAYLRRSASDGQIQVTPGLATYQVDAYLRGDRAPGSRVICTEDTLSHQFAAAIMRRCDRDMLTGCRFVEAGGADQVRQAVRILREGGLKSVGLTDGDMADAGKNGVLALPGGDAPERVIFNDPAVIKFFADDHDLALPELMVTVADHHDIAAAVGKRLGLETAVIHALACNAYVADRPIEEFRPCMTFLESELR